MTVALRGAKWGAPDNRADEAAHDACTLAGLCETALQVDNEGGDVTALLTVMKEKAERAVNALDPVTK
ncbi:hypothetical protein GE300_16000 [Rhodobacteraceae bacterium 2CG4]|uniref:Uncharacterized protein n=1 Tax=Halovulum marinum TaxID=2662447 RepID=A0A6L5Z3D9_9RHOB|nr:hypothetical protein [Halovulum marinum]MSU91093.1 hypothetical protein [Halovulum marinum]